MSPIPDQSCELRLNFSLVVPLLRLLLPRLLDKLLASHIPAIAALSPELPEPGVPGRLCPWGAVWSAAAVHVPCLGSSAVICAPWNCTRQSQGCWLGKDHAGAGGVGSEAEWIGSIRGQGEEPLLWSSERVPVVCSDIHLGCISSALLSC